MVMTQQEVMGRSLNRAGGDTFEDQTVKVGKKTCTCEFNFIVAGDKVKKATGACDKKCSGTVKTMTLAGDEYLYTFGFSSKKGKVKMGKATVIELGGSTGGPVGGGSGMPGGGIGSGCVCVFAPQEIGGSEMPPLPPTMPPGGSGTGMPPMPPGGSGSEMPGETLMPPTGSGSGTEPATPLPPFGGNETGEQHLGLGCSLFSVSFISCPLLHTTPTKDSSTKSDQVKSYDEAHKTRASGKYQKQES